MLTAPTVYLVLGTLRADDDKAWLYGQLLTYRSPVTDELLDKIADGLVFTWCGVPRWFAQRLWEEVLGNWAGFEGTLSSRGVDVGALPAARATRLVWSTLVNWHANDKDKGQAWKARIEVEPLPDPAVLRRTLKRPATDSGDGESFMAVFGAVGGRAR